MNDQQFNYLHPAGWITLGLCLILSLSVIVLAETGAVFCSAEKVPRTSIHDIQYFHVEGNPAFCNEDTASSSEDLDKAIGTMNSGTAKVLLGVLVAIGLLSLVVFRDRRAGVTHPVADRQGEPSVSEQSLSFEDVRVSQSDDQGVSAGVQQALSGIEKLRDDGVLSEAEARRQKIDLLRDI